jgi:hypothetical protein
MNAQTTTTSTFPQESVPAEARVVILLCDEANMLVVVRESLKVG